MSKPVAPNFSGSNDDVYTGIGKIWEIAARFNDESRKHSFDRHGNKLTCESKTRRGEPTICPKLSSESMARKQCMKKNTINVSRRKISKKDYKPVGLL